MSFICSKSGVALNARFGDRFGYALRLFKEKHLSDRMQCSQNDAHFQVLLLCKCEQENLWYLLNTQQKASEKRQNGRNKKKERRKYVRKGEKRKTTRSYKIYCIRVCTFILGLLSKMLFILSSLFSTTWYMSVCIGYRVYIADFFCPTLSLSLLHCGCID